MVRCPSFALVVAAALALTQPTPPAAAQTNNPFPNAIAPGVTVPVVNFATIPRSGNNQPPRLNYLIPAHDGTGRLFVNDQRGTLYALSANGATVTPYLNLATVTPPLNLTTATGEQGFQSFAFHPQFNAPGTPGFGKLYTVHSTTDTSPAHTFTPGGGNNTHDEVLLEWTTAAPTAATFTGTVRELVRLEQPFTNHNSGNLTFNPNAAPGTPDFGNLYWGVGDGGSGGDPLDLALNLSRPYGKILRINPLGNNSANGRYGIPSDNPFANDGNAGTLGEVWAYGLRNPQRISFDTAGAGRMFIADIGQGVVEEISVGVSGGNYGWRDREGSFEFLGGGSVGANTRNSNDGRVYPVAEYDHQQPNDPSGATGNNAVTGGWVYRRGDIPGLFGQFLLGDFPTGRIYYFDADQLPDGGQDPLRELFLNFNGLDRTFLQIINQARADQGLGTTSRTDLRFGLGSEGQIFLLNKQDGTIRLLVPEPASLATLALAAIAFLARRRCVCQ